MKSIKNYILITLIYLLGINFYFSFWYLGSEGGALQWSYRTINFYHVWLGANLTALIIMVSVLLIRRLSVNLRISSSRSIRLDLLLQWSLGVVLFTTLMTANCAVLASEGMGAAINYTMSTGFLALNLYHFSLFLIIIALLNLNRCFGGVKRVIGYIFRWIYPPREVERGFIFIDLNHSTRIAEKLNSENYSAFLRDCFRLLNEAVGKEDGIEIYQYVGDEAILHWDYTNDRLALTVPNLFERFKQSLIKQSNYFKGRYGMIPTFKAAVHGGLVTQSEISEKMIHTAFHGDVVNTTSRILSMCHKHETDFLISASFYKRLNTHQLDRKYIEINDVVLNGKVHKLTVYKPMYTLNKSDKTFL
ncbi:MAG: adenylate/guanylate cyclase domain-containing protein [Bacteroidota bacterium]